MDSRLYFPQPVGSPQTGAAVSRSAQTGTRDRDAFAKILNQALDQQSVKFSAHARQRLNSRDIDLRPEDIRKVNQAVEQARAKGAKESLVLMDDLAFVVSVKNNTVITVLDKPSFQNNVFTNIDSTVVI